MDGKKESLSFGFLCNMKEIEKGSKLLFMKKEFRVTEDSFFFGELSNVEDYKEKAIYEFTLENGEKCVYEFIKPKDWYSSSYEIKRSPYTLVCSENMPKMNDENIKKIMCFLYGSKEQEFVRIIAEHDDYYTFEILSKDCYGLEWGEDESDYVVESMSVSSVDNRESETEKSDEMNYKLSDKVYSVSSGKYNRMKKNEKFQVGDVLCLDDVTYKPNGDTTYLKPKSVVVKLTGEDANGFHEKIDVSVLGSFHDHVMRQKHALSFNDPDMIVVVGTKNGVHPYEDLINVSVVRYSGPKLFYFDDLGDYLEGCLDEPGVYLSLSNSPWSSYDEYVGEHDCGIDVDFVPLTEHDMLKYGVTSSDVAEVIRDALDGSEELDEVDGLTDDQLCKMYMDMADKTKKVENSIC